MELVSVDMPLRPAKNGTVLTDEERTRLGLKLRALRVERGLRQVDAAEKAGLSVGTLQAIEGTRGHVKDDNVEKLAKIYGTSALKILKKIDEPVTPTNPLLKGLNEEHLDIAQRYKDARKRVRAAIELILSREDDSQLATVLLQIAALPPESRAHLEQVLAATDLDSPIFALAHRIGALRADDLRTLGDYLDLMDRQRTATGSTTTKPLAKASTTKTKRAPGKS